MAVGRHTMSLLFALVCLGAPPALAEDEALEQRLQQGEIVVKVKARHPIYDLDVHGLVEAPTERVWEVLTAYDRYDEFLPLVTESKAQKRTGNQVMQFLKMTPPWPFHVHWMVNVCTEEKARWFLSWRMAEGNVKMEHGYWQLKPLGPERTRLHYHLTVDPWMDSVPSWVFELVTRQLMPETVRGIRQRVRQP